MSAALTLADELDLERVGKLLLRAVAAAALCRHASPRLTARDYLHPSTPEEEFVCEILSDGRTADLEAKWFGGNAVRWGMQ